MINEKNKTLIYNAISKKYEKNNKTKTDKEKNTLKDNIKVVKDNITSINETTKSVPNILKLSDIQIISINIYSNYIYGAWGAGGEIIYTPVLEVKFKYNNDTYIKIYKGDPAGFRDEKRKQYKKYNHMEKITNIKDLVSFLQPDVGIYFDIIKTKTPKTSKTNTYTLRFCYKDLNNTPVHIEFLSFIDT